MTEPLPARPLAVGDRVSHRTHRPGVVGIVQFLDARGKKARVRWGAKLGPLGWYSWVMFKYLRPVEAAEAASSDSASQDSARAITNLTDYEREAPPGTWITVARDDLRTLLNAVKRTP